MNLLFSDLLQQHFKCRSAAQFIALMALTSASITAVAEETPVIINQETGAQVDLIRPYWNANVDIANRKIQCDHFMFDPETAVYEKREISGHPAYTPWRSHGEFFHIPLYEGIGASTVEHLFLPEYVYNTWNVTDGWYSGMGPLGGFIELVTYNAASNDIENNAVRVWQTLEDTDPYYHLCYDLDGAPLAPTGSAGIGNTDLLPEQNFTFQLPPAANPVTKAPEIIRLDTGEPVEFVRAEFDYNADIKGKRLNCGPFQWNEELGRYLAAQRGIGLGSYYTFNYAYTGATHVPFVYGVDDYPELPSEGAVDGFLQNTTWQTSFIEVIDSGYNVWSNPLAFQGCRFSDTHWAEGLEPFAPNSILLTAQGSCDYSDADQYDGWGWNAATEEGCPPENNNAANATDEDCVDEQTNTENGTSEDVTDDGNNNESATTVTNSTDEQSSDGNNSQVETGNTDDSSATTNNGAAAVSTEEQSNTVDNSPAQTSGSGAADKFLLLFLIGILCRYRQPAALLRRN